MNRTLGQAKENSMISRIFIFGNLGHAIVALALMLSLPATAMAQYGRGGMGRHPHTQEACDRPTGQEV